MARKARVQEREGDRGGCVERRKRLEKKGGRAGVVRQLTARAGGKEERTARGKEERLKEERREDEESRRKEDEEKRKKEWERGRGKGGRERITGREKRKEGRRKG
ncbi:MAG: hypothetical protein I3J02_03865 [Prevotella sp.]|nr:hypothetical protein [Prevotella sp.]